MNSKQIVYLSQSQYAELIANGSITVNGVTVEYNENDIYVTPQAEPVTDVRINGASVAANGVANIPVMNTDTYGVAKAVTNDATANGIRINGSGVLQVAPSNDTDMKNGTAVRRPIVSAGQHLAAFYGLAKAAGHDEASSTESVGTYTPEAKGAIQQMLGVSDLFGTSENDLVASKAYKVGDVFTANGKLYKATAAIAADAAIITDGAGANCEETSVGEGFVKFTDIASVDNFGVVRADANTNSQFGVYVQPSGTRTGLLRIAYANDTRIKNGVTEENPITPFMQHKATFYGLAKAAGADEKDSTLPVGTYTDTAKSAIRTMLGAASDNIIAISDTAPTDPDTKIWISETATSVQVPTVSEMESALQSNKELIANIEDTNVASKRYAAGDTFIYNGSLYQTLMDINQYDTLVPGENCKLINVDSGFLNKTAWLFYNTNYKTIMNYDGSDITDAMVMPFNIECELKPMLLDSSTTGDPKVFTPYESITVEVNSDYYASPKTTVVELPRPIYSGAIRMLPNGFAIAYEDCILLDFGTNGISVENLNSGYKSYKLPLPIIEIPIAMLSFVCNVTDNQTYSQTETSVGYNENDGTYYVTVPESLDISKVKILAKILSNDRMSIQFEPLATEDGHCTIGCYESTTHTLGENSVINIDYIASTEKMIQESLNNIVNPTFTENYADDTIKKDSMFLWNQKIYGALKDIPAYEEFVPVGTVEDSDDANCYQAFFNEEFVSFSDYASSTNAGVVMVNSTYGLKMLNGNIMISPSTISDIKNGNNSKAISPGNQHASTFYGLATAAGDTTQSASSNAVGVYTDNAKASIKSMLGIVDGSTGTVDITGATPAINAVENTRYVCGEVTSLSFTPPSSGISIVRFTSGSTVTVLTIPSTVKFPEWFDPTALETNTIYEICVTDGTFGAVMSWAL